MRAENPYMFLEFFGKIYLKGRNYFLPGFPSTICPIKLIFIFIVAVGLSIGSAEKSNAQTTPTPTATYCCQTLWSYPQGNTTFSTDTVGLAYDPSGPGTLYVGGLSDIQAVNPSTGVTLGTLPGSYVISMMNRGQDGFLYVGDANNYAVYKVILPSGARAATFGFPSDIVKAIYVDDQSPGEDIYVGGVSGNAYKVSQTGPVITQLVFAPDAPAPTRGSCQGLLLQEGIGGAPATFYFSDPLNNRVLKFVQAAAGSVTYGYVSTITTGGFAYPHQLLKNGSGEIYLAANGGYWIFDPTFQVVLASCSSASVLYDAQGIASDSSGAVYLGSTVDNGALMKLGCPVLTSTSTPAYSGSNPPGEGQCFVYPSPARGDHATVSYYMAEPGKIQLKVWNHNGELVTEVTDQKPAGVQITPFSIAGILPGVYFYSLALSYDSGGIDKPKAGEFAVIH